MEYLLWYLSMALAATFGFLLCSVMSWRQRGLLERRIGVLRRLAQYTRDAERHLARSEMANRN